MLLYVTAYGGNRLYRNDDAVVTTNGGFPHVLLNQTATANHWLTVDLTGRRSNRDAIGAEITVTTGHRTQLVTVSTCGSYLSASDNEPTSDWGQQPSSIPWISNGRAVSANTWKT
jgi:hypothetical protein